MKLGLLSPFPPKKCGVGIYSYNLYRNLKDKVDVIRIGDNESDSDFKINFCSFKLGEQLQRIIESQGIDIIHVEYNAPQFGRLSLNAGLISALRSIKIPKVITLHEVQYDRKCGFIEKARLGILRLIEKKLISYSDRVIVHTPNQAEFLRKKYSTKKVECIYHGLELKDIIKKNTKNLLFLGIITPSKGVHYLIGAMSGLSEYNLTIAGDTPKGMQVYKKKLLSLISEKGLKNVKTDFRWIPENDKEEYFRSAGIVVLPYTWAPYQSGVLHSAVSYGIPVVVTNTGSLGEIAKEFLIGEVIKPGISEEISEGIKVVSKNYSKYSAGIMKYRKVANWETVSNKHAKLYASLLKNIA